MSVVEVKIENDYSDGHHSECVVELELPDDMLIADLDDWFNEVVFPKTGDGHGADEDLGSCYTATILTGKFTGCENEWL
jgi:hypothetical protein